MNDPGQSIVVDVYNSPIPLLSFEDVVIYRLHDLTDESIKQASKLPIKADDDLHQGIAIVEEYNRGRIKRGCRFFQFLYGYYWIEYHQGSVLAEINERFLRIIHSDNARVASEALHPAPFVLEQGVRSRTNEPIQMYVYPYHHEHISILSGRLGLSMSDYGAICLWSGVLGSGAPLPERIRAKGNSMISAFCEQCSTRLKDMVRLGSEL